MADGGSIKREEYILIARLLNRDTPTNIEYGNIWGYMGIPTGDGDLWYGFRIFQNLKVDSCNK